MRCAASASATGNAMSPHRLTSSTARSIRVPDSISDSASATRGTGPRITALRSEEHTSELQSLMRISYAVFCLKKNNQLLAPCRVAVLDRQAEFLAGGTEIDAQARRKDRL